MNIRGRGLDLSIFYPFLFLFCYTVRMQDIICIGSAVRDIFVFSDEFEIIKTPRITGGVAECVPLGSKVDVDEIFVTTGGGATNAAATFARLGLKTGIISKIGDDEDGDLIFDDLSQRSVDTSLLIKDRSGDTGLGIQLTTSEGERTVLVYRGVSGSFEARDILVSKIKSHALYLSSVGGSIDVLQKIKRFIDKRNIFLAWNPGNLELKLGLRKLRPILASTNVLILNKEEALKLRGNTKKPEHLSVIGLAQELQSNPEQIVIITNGDKGTYCLSPEGAYHIGTRHVKSISRTGAGDAFGSATVASLLSGYSVLQSLKIGTHNAESVIQSYGAKQGIINSFPSTKIISGYKHKML